LAQWEEINVTHVARQITNIPPDGKPEIAASDVGETRKNVIAIPKIATGKNPAAMAPQGRNPTICRSVVIIPMIVVMIPVMIMPIIMHATAEHDWSRKHGDTEHEK
jgi:hypothetical protein